MQNRPNNKKQKFWGSWRCNVLLLFFSLVAIYGFFGSVSKYSMAREKYMNSRDELEKLENNKQKLESSLSMLSTEFGEEQVIRDKFNVVKEGEGLIVIVDEKDSSSQNKGENGGFIDFLGSLFD